MAARAYGWQRTRGKSASLHRETQFQCRGTQPLPWPLSFLWEDRRGRDHHEQEKRSALSGRPHPGRLGHPTATAPARGVRLCGAGLSGARLPYSHRRRRGAGADPDSGRQYGGAPAAAASVIMLAMGFAGLLAISIPAITNWIDQGPFLTYTMERKLEGLRKSIAIVQQVSKQVEQATTAPANPTEAAKPPDKVVVRDKTLLGEVASTTPGVLLQIGYAAVLAFMLLAHRNTSRRQILRVPRSFAVRVHVARILRDINERVGQYLFSLAVIYSAVAAVATVALAALGFPNAIVWGVLMGIAGFVPFIGSAVMIAVVALVALLTFDDWPRILAAPAVLLAIHVLESQFVTPMFVSRRCALNTVAVFGSIALLGWMWGTI